MATNTSSLHTDILFGAFTGKSSSGSITLTNEDVQVGDIVSQVIRIGGTADGQASESYFETTISVAGEIQQTAGTNLSGDFFLLVLRRPSS